MQFWVQFEIAVPRGYNVDVKTEAGDIDTVRDIYAPDAVVWHNDDLIEQPVEENLKTLAGTVRAISGLHYDIIRRVATPDGVLHEEEPLGLQTPSVIVPPALNWVSRGSVAGTLIVN